MSMLRDTTCGSGSSRTVPVHLYDRKPRACVLQVMTDEAAAAVAGTDERQLPVRPPPPARPSVQGGEVDSDEATALEPGRR